MFTAQQLKAERHRKKWTQQEAAARLDVSQPYLALLERGQRKLTPSLARRFLRVYDFTPEALPVSTDFVHPRPVGNDELMGELAALGYPGFSHVRHRRLRNPAEVLFGALAMRNLDSRLAEALPWVVLRYPGLDWDWLLKAVKVHDLQNRLGFVVSVTRQFAQEQGHTDKARRLAKYEAVLERAKLVKEDTLAQESLTVSEQRWLRQHRPEPAGRWNLLTDFASHNLGYAY